MQRSETPSPVAAPSRTEGTRLSVEEGGKQSEDELDIPAFLRRQAN
jgi:cell division protein FtsZ